MVAVLFFNYLKYIRRYLVNVLPAYLIKNYSTDMDIRTQQFCREENNGVQSLIECLEMQIKGLPYKKPKQNNNKIHTK